MNIKNLVSIITPTYNSGLYIANTIEAILMQTYTNWELLITDDCSTDNSCEIIEIYKQKDSRIKLFRLNKNSGAAIVRNNSIQNAKGKYIAFCDSDDIWYKDKLEKQLCFMQKNNYAFTFSSYSLIDSNSKDLNKIIHAVKSIDYNQYLKNTIIGCLTVVIDKELVGDFRMPVIKSGQDMGLWLLIMKKGIIAYGLDENLASYRVGIKSLSSNKLSKLKHVWKVYNEIEGFSITKSLYLLCFYVINALKKRL
jgi:teichuronic acid biosynthesis glycosyltransferase TuaG